jgi:dipeptidyl aminopeptidase/acylaminoacyl peptidase
MIRAKAVLLLLIGFWALPLRAQQRAELPPLIDRDVFFGDPEIAGAQISPDGRHITFLKTNAGQINIWVKGRAEPFSAARPLTADSTRPITGYFWSRDARYVLYVHDNGGDENFHVYAVDPTTATPAKLPVARDLTPYGKVQARIVALPKTAPNHILAALNDRDVAAHDVYRIDLTTGARELLFENHEKILDFTADRAGRLRLGTRVAGDGLGTEVFRIDGAKSTLLFTLTCDVFQGCAPVRFHKDGRRVYVTTAGPHDNFTHLALYDLENGAWEKVEEDPEKEVDFGGAEFSVATDELVATYYMGDRLRVYPKDSQFEKDLATVRQVVGDGDLDIASSSADDRLHIVSVTKDIDPSVTYLYDRESGKVELLYRPRPKLPLQHLANMKPVRYTARDGLVIPAYLTVPKGVPSENLPAIVLPHGGPWGRDTWGYNSFAQFLANRGYAVLMPNFRGSTGFGRKFLDAGNNEWGTGAMQHDISDGVQWLIKERIADPKRVAIMGGSYGGYAALAGVAYTPDLYAAGVSIVGPSSIPTLLASIPPYWAPIKKSFDVRVGDPANPADMERLKAQSPLYSATKIKAPLLVIQGANDPRVNKAESDQIVVALREMGRSPSYLVAPDEGHGFARRENRVAMFAAIEKFLAQHLGGRYQKDMPKDIEARLALLTVNADTLKLKAAVSKAADPVIFDGKLVKPASLSYKQTMAMTGRNLDVSGTTTVSEHTADGKKMWLVVDEAHTPMGVISDSVVMDLVTLAPVSRVVHQGPATVEIRVKADSVIGSIKAGPQELPVKAHVNAPVYMEGGALNVALGTLSLEPGFTASYRVFDIMSAKAKEQTLEVVGAETVTVPAGTFETVKLEVKPADGSSGGATYWIEKALRRVVKSEVSLPAQMGGGKAISELTK